MHLHGVLKIEISSFSISWTFIRPRLNSAHLELHALSYFDNNIILNYFISFSSNKYGGQGKSSFLGAQKIVPVYTHLHLHKASARTPGTDCLRMRKIIFT